MSQENVDIGVAYYTAMGKKDIAQMSKYMHPNIHFISPMGEVNGKEALVESVKGFLQSFNTLSIRLKFSEGEHAMLVCDLDFPAPVGPFRSAALLKIQNKLITRIELFFDASQR